MQSIALLLTVVLVVSASQFDCESDSIAGSCDIVDRECAKHNSGEWVSRFVFYTISCSYMYMYCTGWYTAGMPATTISLANRNSKTIDLCVYMYIARCQNQRLFCKSARFQSS